MWMLNPRDEVAQKIDDQVPVYVVAYVGTDQITA